MKMYISNHLDLLFRFERGGKLRDAIFEAVKEGDLVFDAGCGTGILSFWAVQAGAKRVLAVDNADLSLAKELTEENGFSNRIEFMHADLFNVRLPDSQRCNVLIGMVYFNDPRRDEQQSALMHTVRSNVLSDSGQQIPDRIEYIAYAAEWPSQDVATKHADVDRKVSMMESRYGLSLQSLAKKSKTFPDPKWFPVRNSTGLLERADARLLSETTSFGIDYGEPFSTYPESLVFTIIQPGFMNAVIFVQNQYYKESLIFSNESVSWIINPHHFATGRIVEIPIDEVWRTSNVFSISTL
jgi:ubiquinone/menaquinone biosynthesis C-methylase UbiE